MAGLIRAITSAQDVWCLATLSYRFSIVIGTAFFLYQLDCKGVERSLRAEDTIVSHTKVLAPYTIRIPMDGNTPRHRAVTRVEHMARRLKGIDLYLCDSGRLSFL